MVTDYQEINQANWDDRVPTHLASDYYRVQSYLAEPDFISHVVRFDLPRLGDVSGLRGAHLQCHIGTDTISLARLGASMTGLDFSGAAVEAAQTLASNTRADATFVQRLSLIKRCRLEPCAGPSRYGRGDSEHHEPAVGSHEESSCDCAASAASLGAR